jgi:hypothetical protein
MIQKAKRSKINRAITYFFLIPLVALFCCNNIQKGNNIEIESNSEFAENYFKITKAIKNEDEKQFRKAFNWFKKSKTPNVCVGFIYQMHLKKPTKYTYTELYNSLHRFAIEEGCNNNVIKNQALYFNAKAKELNQSKNFSFSYCGSKYTEVNLQKPQIYLERMLSEQRLLE